MAALHTFPVANFVQHVAVALHTGQVAHHLAALVVDLAVMVEALHRGMSEDAINAFVHA
ncbi:MAG: hypothetical protein HZT43_11835 [Exiguobacterium profundum]|nr:MAG: hypothetical protein HZT43_11835 [Exiguobacterium profundum]